MSSPSICQRCHQPYQEYCSPCFAQYEQEQEAKIDEIMIRYLVLQEELKNSKNLEQEKITSLIKEIESCETAIAEVRASRFPIFQDSAQPLLDEIAENDELAELADEIYDHVDKG